KDKVTHRRFVAVAAADGNRQSDEKNCHIRSLALIARLGCLRPCWVPPPGQLWPPVSVTHSSTGAAPGFAACRSQWAPGTVSARRAAGSARLICTHLAWVTGTETKFVCDGPMPIPPPNGTWSSSAA